MRSTLLLEASLANPDIGVIDGVGSYNPLLEDDGIFG